MSKRSGSVRSPLRNIIRVFAGKCVHAHSDKRNRLLFPFPRCWHGGRGKRDSCCCLIWIYPSKYVILTFLKCSALQFIVSLFFVLTDYNVHLFFRHFSRTRKTSGRTKPSSLPNTVGLMWKWTKASSLERLTSPLVSLKNSLLARYVAFCFIWLHLRLERCHVVE